MEDSQNTQQLSFGEKAVGLSFNPSGNDEVGKIKRLYADVIDQLNNAREEINGRDKTAEDGEKLRLLSIAITEAQSAQMWAVKAVTWKS